ncbi:NAD(P)/FAD-dependent oxidoreductase [Actinomadura sp. 3N508]|uniref:NAD(P)/FAD-dependent oxidoreductase n=1 Tax=Actinomadura sp. 3N508 TaxID=3375153 RepID=UPI00378C3986
MGAGIIGASLADRLTRPAASGGSRDEVTVVEAEVPGAGTSGTSYAWINANDPADPSYHRFRTAAMATWRDLAAGFGAPAWYRPAGNTIWATADDAKSQLADRVAKLADLGYTAELIDPARLRELEPHLRPQPDALIAHYAGESFVHGGSVSQALTDRAREAGATLVTGHRALRLNTEGDRVIGVHLDDGRDLDADLTICAAGRHSPALLATAGVTLPLVDPSVPGSEAPCLVATTSPTDAVVNGLVHAPGLSVRAAEGGGLVLESVELDAGVDESASPALMQMVGDELLTRARALIPGLTAEIAGIRRCVRPLPLDGYPLIGAQRPGLYTAVAHSGITLGPHLAALIDREIHGHAAPELAPYRPDRPIS